MDKLNHVIVQEFIFKLKVKYKNILQELKIDYRSDKSGEYIYLVLIKIKPSQRCRGFGNAVMSEITSFADQYNVEIRLWVTNIFGSEIKRLYSFYFKHGFILIKDENDGHMKYYPKKIKK